MEHHFQMISESPGHMFYPVRPADIDTSHGIVGNFGKHEVEVSAANLVGFFKEKGGWFPFLLEDLLSFSEGRGFDPNRVFFGLMGAWIDDAVMGGIHEPEVYLVHHCGGFYCVTDIFIKRCVRESLAVAG